MKFRPLLHWVSLPPAITAVFFILMPEVPIRSVKLAFLIALTIFLALLTRTKIGGKAEGNIVSMILGLAFTGTFIFLLIKMGMPFLPTAIAYIAIILSLLSWLWAGVERVYREAFPNHYL